MAVAFGIFAVSYILIATERFPRHAVALLGAVAVILINIFPFQDAFNYVDWETIGLLFGTFILIMILAESGFFGWFASHLVERLHYRPTYLFIALPLVAALLAAAMDSVTVMVFLSPLSIRIAKLIKIDPVPLIVAEVCSANTGGAATLIGNPPNVILGTILGFGFNDFLVHSAPIATLSTLVLVAVFFILNRKMLVRAEQELNGAALAGEDLEEKITDGRSFKVGLVFFTLAIFLLITNKFPMPWQGLAISPATATLLPALLAMIVGGEATRHVVRKIDFESLLFFIGLFIMMGALVKTQFIAVLAHTIFQIGQGNPFGLVLMLQWGSGLTSAVVDNIPMALAMAYVMKDIGGLVGLPALSLMVWSLALGVEIGGNMTPVGASANVIAYSYMEHLHGKVGWWRWIKMTVPPTIAAMFVASLMLYVKYLIRWY